MTTAIGPRHRWVKLRVHVYICRVCGMGKENDPRKFTTTFHCPDGNSVRGSHPGPCVAGPRTEAALAKYATEIAAHDNPDLPHVYRARTDLDETCAVCRCAKALGAHLEAASS